MHRTIVFEKSNLKNLIRFFLHTRAHIHIIFRENGIRVLFHRIVDKIYPQFDTTTVAAITGHNYLYIED